MNIDNTIFMNDNSINQLTAYGLLFSLCHTAPSSLEVSENALGFNNLTLDFELFCFILQLILQVANSLLAVKHVFTEYIIGILLFRKQRVVSREFLSLFYQLCGKCFNRVKCLFRLFIFFIA